MVFTTRRAHPSEVSRSSPDTVPTVGGQRAEVLLSVLLSFPTLRYQLPIRGRRQRDGQSVTLPSLLPVCTQTPKKRLAT